MGIFARGSGSSETFSEYDRKEAKKTIELTALGQKAKSLLISLNDIDTHTEVSEIIYDLNHKLLDSQMVRERLRNQRDLLQAKIALIQALFAILPAYRENGFTGCQKPLNIETTTTSNSN